MNTDQYTRTHTHTDTHIYHVVTVNHLPTASLASRAPPPIPLAGNTVTIRHRPSYTTQRNADNVSDKILRLSAV